MQPADIVREIYQSAVEIPEPFSSLSEDERQFASRLMDRFEEAEAKYGVLPHVELLRPMLLSKNGVTKKHLPLRSKAISNLQIGRRLSPQLMRHDVLAIWNALLRCLPKVPNMIRMMRHAGWRLETFATGRTGVPMPWWPTKRC